LAQTSTLADTAGVAIQVSRGVVVAFVQVDLDENVMARFQDDLLGRIQQTEARGAIIDLSGLEIIDSGEFAALRRVISAATIMGTRTVLVGLRPGVVSSLIEAGVQVDGLLAAVSLDAAFAMFEPESTAEHETPDSEDPDAPENEAGSGEHPDSGEGIP
jgi:rsbT antagonist protein RsbS